MTATLVYTLICNGCGKRYASFCPRASEARAVAYREGWTHRIENQGSVLNQSLDFCPDCKTPDGHRYTAPKPGVVISTELARYARLVFKSHQRGGAVTLSRKDLLDQMLAALGDP